MRILNNLVNSEESFPMDTRSKLVLIIFLFIYSVVAVNIKIVGLFVILSAFIYYSGHIKVVFAVLAFNIFFWFLFDNFLIDIRSTDTSKIDFFITIAGRSTIMTATAFWFALSTSVTSLANCLEKMKIPNYITLPFIIAVRFLPTMITEIMQIKEALYIRKLYKPGLKISNIKVTLKYFFIPLIIRSIKMSEELAAAGEARGISRPGERTFLNPPKFSKIDYVVILYWTIAIMLLEVSPLLPINKFFE